MRVKKAKVNKEVKEDIRRTGPGQNISLGHQACTGGRGTCEGNVAVRGAVGLATAVTCVRVGTPVITLVDAVVVSAWGTARVMWMAQAKRVHFASIVLRRDGDVPDAETLREVHTVRALSQRLLEDFAIRARMPVVATVMGVKYCPTVIHMAVMVTYGCGVVLTR